MGSEAAVGFIGLGAMGSAMAMNLQLALAQGIQGFANSLHVFNRTAEKAKPLLDKGAEAAQSPAELASKCSVVFSMMANDAALLTVFDDYLSGRPQPSSIYVDCSTVYPGVTEALASRAESAGITFLSCPVFGRPDAAAAKKLLVLASGNPGGIAKVKPLLEAMGRGVVDVGSNPRCGAAAKLVGNFMISGFIELAAEAFALAEASGVDRGVASSIACELFPGPIPQGYASRIASNVFHIGPDKPGFPVTGGIKDVSHMIRLAEDGGTPLPIADATIAHMREVEARGGGGLDWGALALAVRAAANLDIPEGLLQK